LYLTVLASSDNTAISTARIAVRNGNNTFSEIRCDENGYAHINLKSGQYIVTVAAVGYITQDIQIALQKAKVEESEFAALCTFNKNTSSEWSGLRYSEFISLNTWQIQKLKPRVTQLESELEALKEKIALLEGKI
jgi:hypothetical protein